jgi:hypothetical protein
MAPILSYRPLEPEKSAAVVTDGLPRVARYIEHFDDAGVESFGAEVLHVLYLNGGTLPHSMLAADWPGPLPPDPTLTESAAAIAARETARGNRRAAALLRRQGMLALAESAVGVKVGQLTPRQVEALLGVVLLQADALDDGLLVRPLEEWVK